MEGTLKLIDGTHFEAVSGSGFTVDMDVPIAHGGTGKGASPMEFVLLGVAGCTAFDVVSILKKKRAEIDDCQVSIKAKRAPEHPKVFTAISAHFIITGRKITDKAVKKAIELSEEKYCSASAMIKQTASIEVTYEIIEKK